MKKELLKLKIDGFVDTSPAHITTSKGINIELQGGADLDIRQDVLPSVNPLN